MLFNNLWLSSFHCEVRLPLRAKAINYVLPKLRNQLCAVTLSD